MYFFPEFLFNDWLLQRGPVLLKCNDSPLRRLKRWRGKGDEKKLPSFCSFEQPLICTKFRFALPFRDQRLTRKYYSIITGMLNQQNAIVKVLTGGFSPQKERFGGFPSHAICATVHIKSTWNFMLLGLYVLCGWSACVCVCRVFLSRTLACKTMHPQKHTLTVSSISAVKPDPPRLFSLVIMSKFAQEGRGKGRAMWTCVGVFCFFFFFPYKTRFWLPPISNARDPNHLLKPFKRKARKHFPPCPFSTKTEDWLWEGETLYLPSNKYIKYKCKECREKSSLVESLEGNW